MDYELHVEDFKKLDKELSYLSTHSVRIGFLNDTDKNDNGDVILYYALKNEYGSPADNVPSRPFFRTAITKNAKNIEERMNKNMLKVINGKMKGDQALINIGILIKGYIQDSIRNGNWEKNSKKTLENKRGTKPLIDEGSMLETVDYEIIKR